MRGLLITTVFLFFTICTVAQQKIQYQLCNHDFRPIYMHANLPSDAIYIDTNASATARAEDVLRRLTFNEKLKLTGGWHYMYFPGISRLGLRPIHFSDASQGLRIDHYYCVSADKTTSFPSELALAATWDTKLAYDYARCIGEECKAWGVSVLLGPGLNMYRNSEGGRNYEYMGEDPFLTSTMGVQYIKGLQSTGTLATPKHLICNDQEFGRSIGNLEVGKRALREIYLRPFLAAVQEGKAMSVMNGNNFVNGYPGAGNVPVSENMLRKEYGFKGIIMSDWGNSMFWPKRQALVFRSGESLLMPDNTTFETFIREALKRDPEKKKMIEKGLDSMVFHSLYTFFKMGFYDRPYRDPALVARIGDHKEIALQTAEEAITLLKNEDHILPINPNKVSKIVVLGTDSALTDYAGTGSGHVMGYGRVDYLTGLKEIYGDKIIRKKDISDEEIRSADVVLYFINKEAGEHFDVPFDMPGIHQKIVRYAELNKNLIVIYSGGNGFAMPWLSKTKGLIFAYLLGQESGIALANIISGRTNPSGKLPFTIEKSFRNSPACDYNKINGTYYWIANGKAAREYKKEFGKIMLPYKEGIFIGYRWYEKMDIQPRFPFGYGLSYTAFRFSNIKRSSPVIKKKKAVTISFRVQNKGRTAGAEVTQLYIHKISPAIDRPVKELKGFRRVFLKPGESKTVRIPVHFHDFAFWSMKKNQWKVNPGEYVIEVGTSSQDIRQKIVISVPFDKSRKLVKKNTKIKDNNN